MRIEPDQQLAARARQPESSKSTDKGFASTLATARDSSTAGTLQAIDPPNERPLAERWGEYGPGATAAGYGPPPDPASFAAHSVGRNSPAHPLNPEGNTTSNPPFTVPGYTGRGTPIPPGFYNLAYYNQYLDEGGTPLEGFPEYRPGIASIAQTYGQFGDGQDRATSFATGLVQPGGTTTVADSATSAKGTAAPVTSSPAPPAVEARADAAHDAPPPPAPATTIAAAERVVADEPAAASTPPRAEAAAETLAIDGAELALANAARAAARVALQSLLDDLLSLG